MSPEASAIAGFVAPLLRAALRPWFLILMATALMCCAFAAPARAEDPQPANVEAPSGVAKNAPFATVDNGRPIYVGIYLHDVTSFDLKNGVFDVDFEMWAKWRGEFEPKHLRVANAASIDRSLLSKESDGDWYSYRWQVRGTLRSEFPLHRFPFDVQALPVTLELPASDGRLVPDLVSSGMAKRFSITDWHYQPIFEPDRSEQVYNSDLGILAHESQPTTVRRVSFRVFLERPTITVLLKLFLPVGIILLVALICLFLPPSQIDARSAIAITALLSTFAFQFTVADSLPQVTYVTLADQLFLLSYFLSSSVLIETVAVYALYRKDKNKLAHRIDRVMQAASPLVLAVGVWSAMPEPYPERPIRVDPIPELPRHASARDTVRVGRAFLSTPNSFADNYWPLMTERPTGSYHPLFVEQKPGVDSDVMKFLAGGIVEITWRLRDDAKWSDGTAVTAKDLVESFDPSPDSPLREVEQVDDKTVLYRWTDRVSDIFSPPRPYPIHVVGDVPKDARYAHSKKHVLPVLGPYEIVEFEPKERLVAEAHPHFIGATPNIERVELQVYDSDEEFVRAFFENAIDITEPNAITQERILELRKTHPQFVYYEPGPVQLFLAPDMNHPALAQLAVRKALLQAIDRRKLGEAMYQNPDLVSHVPRPGEPPPGTEKTEHDLDAAKEVLDELWPQGEPIKLIYSPTGTTLLGIPSLVEDLEAVGLEVERVESKDAKDLYKSGKHGGLVFHLMRTSIDAPVQRFWNVPFDAGYDPTYRSDAYTDEIALLEFREGHAMYPERREQLREQIAVEYSKRLPNLPLIFGIFRGLVVPELKNWRGNPDDPFGARTDLWYFDGEPTKRQGVPAPPHLESD